MKIGDKVSWRDWHFKKHVGEIRAINVTDTGSPAYFVVGEGTAKNAVWIAKADIVEVIDAS